MTLPSLAFFKTCTKCGCTKPATSSFFGVQRRGLFGLRSICKICSNCGTRKYWQENAEILKAKSREYDAKNRKERNSKRRAYKLLNREKVAEQKRLYRATNADQIRSDARDRYAKDPEKHRKKRRISYGANREKEAKRYSEYYELKKEWHRERARNYYHSNHEQCKARNRQWARDNPELVRAASRKRKATKLAAEHEPYTEADLNALWYDQAGCCFYCQTPLFSVYHIEHMIPLSRGGADKLENICLACPPCNMRKHTKTAEEFMEILGHG